MPKDIRPLMLHWSLHASGLQLTRNRSSQTRSASSVRHKITGLIAEF
jgi:hypothetical protein